jgi:hypothetical protein
MSIIYNQTCINNRLQAVINTIDAGAGNGNLILLAGGTTISTIALQKPSGTVSGGVLTFSGTLLDQSAAGTGSVTGGRIQDSNGNVIVSGLTAGIPLSGADIIISNGLNSTFITATQTVQLLSAQITGS